MRLALIASSMADGRRLPAARCAREEDHAIGVLRDVVEARHHLRLAAPGGRRASARPPTCPASSCARNAATSSSCSSGTSTSPSAMRTSPCPGFIRRNLTARDYGKATGAAHSGSFGGDRSWRARPKTSTGPGARAELAQPVADGAPPRRRARGAPPPAARRPARGARRASRSACSPSRAAAPSGWRSPGSSVSVAPSKNRSVPLVAVPAGDDDVARARARAARARARCRRASSSSASTRASARFGVMTVARATISRRRASTASSASSRAPDSATITGSWTIGVPGGSSSSARATVSIVATSPSIPIFTASIAEVLGDRADLAGDDLRRRSAAPPRRRPCSAR